MSSYLYNSVREVEVAMEGLYACDKEVFTAFTVDELINDAVIGSIIPVAVGEEYMIEYNNGTVCQY